MKNIWSTSKYMSYGWLNLKGAGDQPFKVSIIMALRKFLIGD